MQSMNVTEVGNVTCTVGRLVLHGCNEPFDQLVPISLSKNAELMSC